MDKLILVTIENCEFYRLGMYHDFIERLSLYHPNVKVYGQGYPKTDSKYIGNYDPSKTIQDIIGQDLGGQEPDILFFMNAEIAPSNFSGLKTKVYVFTSDSVITNAGHVNRVRSHKFNCAGVFHNYLYGKELIPSAFNTQHVFYWPCWASVKYDHKQSETGKDIDFFLSGTITHEYSYRQTFREIFRGSGFDYVDRMGQAKDDKVDNDVYLELLSRSRYSPHDGGKNGRLQGRFYEASYMKSVIIAPDAGQEMEINGFRHGQNCILFDRHQPTGDIREMVQRIDRMDWKTLSDNAYSLIDNRHTTDHRIKAFLDVVLQ